MLCQDLQWFNQLHPVVNNAIGDFHFDLDNAAGKIALYDASGGYPSAYCFVQFTYC